MQNINDDSYNKETNIFFDDETETANIYTSSEKMIEKLDSYCKVRPEHFKLQLETELKNKLKAKTYIINKNYINIVNPRQGGI